MAWFESSRDWYRYWDGPEMIEFRARNIGKYQIPIVYNWADEIAAGELGPQVNGENGAPGGYNGAPNGDPSMPAPAPATPHVH